MQQSTSFILYMLLFVLVGCEGKIEKKNTFVQQNLHPAISVTVNFSPYKNCDNVYLSYLDELGEKQTFEINPINNAPAGFVIESSLPVFVMDWTPNQNYYVLFPGEKISIIPASKTDDTWDVTSAEEDKTRTNEHQFFEFLSRSEMTHQSGNFNKLLKTLYKEKGRPATRVLFLIDKLKSKKLKDPALAYQYIYKRYENKLTFLSEYAKAYPISEQYYAIVKSFFKYEFEADLLEVLNNAVKNNIILSADLIRSENTILKDLSCDSCLYIPTYQYALKNYLNYTFSKADITDLKAKSSFIKKTFTGNTQNFCSFILLKNEFITRPQGYEEVLKSFLVQNKQSVYSKYLRKNNTFYNKPETLAIDDKTAIKNTVGQSTSFEELIASLKGRVVLVDFWASWCEPCKRDMHFSNQLHQELKKEDVSFVYFSLDKSAADWSKSAKLLNLNENSFLVTNEFTSPIAKRLRINSIPRYLLIDRNGKIQNLDAPRPGDPLLKDAIKDLLGE